MAIEKHNLPEIFQPDNLNNELYDNWLTLYSKRWFVLFVTAAALIGFTLYYSQKPNVYTAQARILVENVEQVPKTAQDMMAPVLPSQTGEDYYGTQIAILTGRKTRTLVAAEVGPIPGYDISAGLERDTRILSLICKHRDPIMAADIANKFAEVYVRESSRESLFISQQILKWIPEDIENWDSKQSLEGLSNVDKQAFSESLLSVMGDPEVQKLRTDKLEARSKLQALSQRYLPGHPEMKLLSERLEYIDGQLKQRTKTLLDLVRANLAGKINITNVRVLEEAMPPSRPSEPNRRRGILLGALLGFFAAAALVLFVENVSQTVRSERDLESLELPFMGYIPLNRQLLNRSSLRNGGRTSLINVIKKDHLLADALASARTHILFSVPYEKSRRIMITSAVPSEGKSTIACLLAYSLTGLGRKILLIGADIRKPFHYSENKNQKGLTDYLVGNATIDDIIQPFENSPLMVIGSGTHTPNPAELLASERLRELLEIVGERFDRVVVDIPPVLFIPDGLILAKHIHTGVLICGAGMVDKKTVRTVKEKFGTIGYSFIGAIINRADYEKEGYRYKYLNTYKKYYRKTAVDGG